MALTRWRYPLFNIAYRQQFVSRRFKKNSPASAATITAEGAEAEDEIPAMRSVANIASEVRSAHQTAAYASGSLPHFDSFALVRTLRDAGFTEQQAVAVLQALHQTTQEAYRISTATLASRVDFAALKSDLNESIFNANLKNDLRIRHQKDTTNAEFAGIRNALEALKQNIKTDDLKLSSELHIMLKTNLSEISHEMSRLERKIDTNKARLETEHEQVQNRIIRTTIGVAASLAALILGVLRVVY